jgi:hypothetical protein
LLKTEKNKSANNRATPKLIAYNGNLIEGRRVALKDLFDNNFLFLS